MIGASRSLAFDLTAACSGFVVGLVTGAQFIRTRQYRNVLVIGADALSRYVDWRDRGASSPHYQRPAGWPVKPPEDMSIYISLLLQVPES
jgi:3-oxoacyl-(acyl-carrier-protein) synthase